MNEPRVARHNGRNPMQAGLANFEQLRSSFEFLRGFVRNPAQVGSIIPSSPWLEQRLVREAGVQDARCVVELGPGTGGTTAALLHAMPAKAQLLAIELDNDFYRHLRGAIVDGRFILELGSAENLAQYLVARRLPAPDAIISGIPFSTMPADVSDRIAAAVSNVLRPGGRFVAYQVRAHVADFVTPYLGTPAKHWEVVNVPPVRVFTWIKQQSPGAGEGYLKARAQRDLFT